MSALAVAAGLAPAAAHATTPVNLVVSTPVWNCSDTDPARPFCTVAAALASPQLVPGSTITINGYHNEHTTVSASGITLQGDGTVVGLTVSHAQNLTVKATSSSGLWVTDLAVQQSSDVGLHGLIVGKLDIAGSQNVTVDGQSQFAEPATVQDSSGTTFANDSFQFFLNPTALPLLTVTGAGSTGTVILDDYFVVHAGAGIALTGGSSGTSVANDEFFVANGTGVPAAGMAAVAVTGSTGDTIVGTTVRGTAQGVVATAGSSGLTVADDILEAEFGPDVPDTTPFAGAMVVVDDSSTAGSSIHHNVVYQVRTDHYAALVAQPADDSQVLGQQSDLKGDPVATGLAYSWAGVEYQDAASLYCDTGQGNADVNADPQFYFGSDTLRPTSPAIDSADSSVPGWQSTDATGQPRYQDPQVTATGTGPVPYADRGAEEYQGGPTVIADVTPVSRPSTTGGSGLDYGFAVDLSGSTSSGGALSSYFIGPGGWIPPASSSPTGTVWFPGVSGLQRLELGVQDGNGHQDFIWVDVYVGPRAGSGQA